MDFKKFTSATGTLINRAKQYTEEKLGNAEKTEFDESFQTMLTQADKTKAWTEKIIKQTECYLQPNPAVRVEDKMQEKLQGYKATRLMETDMLGTVLTDAGNDLSSGAPAYGAALVKCGEAQGKLGALTREFIQTTVNKFLHPLQTFLDGDMKILQKEKSLLETRRLDLDAVKSKVKRTKPPVTEQLEAELKTAQSDFDTQLDVTKKILDSIDKAHTEHIRHLQDFIEAQAVYFSQAQQLMGDLKKQLSSR